ncbi:rCG23326 [Rattus norvegicus]|uniref:RCG23326 n=1 Tax=Rattus norvegicus TaxID=10116 RepID=A6JQB2_RAT|nr:rCG23326 [Rattus norvegicus]
MRVFLSLAERRKEALVKNNLVLGESVYEEKRVSISEGDDKTEYQA